MWWLTTQLEALHLSNASLLETRRGFMNMLWRRNCTIIFRSKSQPKPKTRKFAEGTDGHPSERLWQYMKNSIKRCDVCIGSGDLIETCIKIREFFFLSCRVKFGQMVLSKVDLWNPLSCGNCDWEKSQELSRAPSNQSDRRPWHKSSILGSNWQH